jgi:hypothetical protein
MICHCGIDHDAELAAPAKPADTGRRDYIVSVQGWRFVSVCPLTKELRHVADQQWATRFTRTDAESALARWIEGEKKYGWHEPGKARVVSAISF